MMRERFYSLNSKPVNASNNYFRTALLLRYHHISGFPGNWSMHRFRKINVKWCVSVFRGKLCLQYNRLLCTTDCYSSKQVIYFNFFQISTETNTDYLKNLNYNLWVLLMTNSVSVCSVNNSYNTRSDFIFGEPVYNGNFTTELKRRNDGRRKKKGYTFYSK